MRKALVSGLLTSTILAAMVSGAGPAAADPALGGDAYAFGATVTLTDTALLPPTPEAEATAPAFPADATETLVPVPADPLAVNGTLIASASVHQAADLASALEVETQGAAGPYNAQAVGQAEDVEILIDAVAAEVPLVEADAVRGEVVAVCAGDTVEYSASSEAVNLVLAGDDTLGGLVNDVIDELFPGLDPLDPVLNVEENVITSLPGGGLAVDALVVTVLEAADAEVGLVQARIGHAELSGVTCGDAGATPECSDGVDNDDDGVSDAEDPGCHTDGDPDNPDSYDPNDDDESDDGVPECSDGVDNDGDGVADIDDPDCHTDGNPGNPDSYDPNDDDEGDGSIPECSDGVDNDGDGVADIDDPQCHTDGDASNPASYDPSHDDEGVSASGLPRTDGLPRTGATVPTAAAAALGTAALALLALRRRMAL